MIKIFIKKYNKEATVLIENITGYKGLNRKPVNCMLVQLNDPVDKQPALIEKDVVYSS